MGGADLALDPLSQLRQQARHLTRIAGRAGRLVAPDVALLAEGVEQPDEGRLGVGGEGDRLEDPVVVRFPGHAVTGGSQGRRARQLQPGTAGLEEAVPLSLLGADSPLVVADMLVGDDRTPRVRRVRELRRADSRSPATPTRASYGAATVTVKRHGEVEKP